MDGRKEGIELWQERATRDDDTSGKCNVSSRVDMVVRRHSAFICALTLIILTSALSAEASDDTQQLFSGIVKAFKASNPVFVVRAEVSVSKNSECDTPCSYLYYNDDASYEEVIQHISALVDSKQLEILFFIGSGHYDLLRQLQNDLGVFNSDTYAIVGSQYRRAGLSLRLDSKILFYERTKDPGFRLLEQYSVMGSRIEKRQVGYWRRSGGLRMTSRGIWERRSNLRGVQLRSAVLAQGALTTVERDSTGGLVTARGPLQDVWRYLEEHLNFTTVLSEPPDGKFGFPSASGWDGAVRMLLDGRADVVTCGLTRTAERAEVVDFALPLFHERATLFMTKSPYLWRSLVLISLIVVSAALPMVNHFRGKAKSSAQLYKIAIFSRVFFFVFGVAGYLTFANYSQSLEDFTVFRPTPAEIKSFDDVVRHNYSVITVKSTGSHGLLASAEPGSPMQRAYREIMEENPEAKVDNIVDARRRLLESDDMTLLFGSSEMMHEGVDDFRQLNITDAIDIQVGWALRKNSELTPLFDHHILKMRQSGLLPKIMAKKNDSDEATFSLGFLMETLPFFVTALGVLVSGVFIGKSVS